MRDPAEPPSSREMSDLSRELYVINGLAETISIIDPETREIYPDVFQTGMWPNHMVFHRDTLYIVNSGDNAISLVDETGFEPLGEIYIGSRSNPWMIIIKPGTDKAYVPNFAAAEVAVVDLYEQTVLSRIPVGNGPEGGAYADCKVYVCNTAWDYQRFDFDEGTVSVIDTETDTVTTEITVGKNPQSAIAFPEMDEIHIICTGKNGGPGSDDGEIYIVDTSTDTVKKTLFIGGSPVASAYGIDEDRQIVYLAGVGGLLAYNYKTKTVLNDSSDYIMAGSDEEGDLFSGIVFDEMTGYIYLSFFSEDKILVLDSKDYSVVEEIGGSDGVQALFLFTE